MTNLLLRLVKYSNPLQLTTTHFECNLLLLGLSFSLWCWALIFYRHMVELSVFQLIACTSPTPFLNHSNHSYTPTTHTTHTYCHAHTLTRTHTRTHVLVFSCDYCDQTCFVYMELTNTI